MMEGGVTAWDWVKKTASPHRDGGGAALCGYDITQRNPCNRGRGTPLSSQHQGHRSEDWPLLFYKYL